SISHAQVMTDVISPMGLSILRLALPFGTSSEDTGYRKDVCHAGGRFYADLSPLLYHPILRKIVPRALSVADELGSLALSDLMQRQEFLDAANRAHDKSRLHTIGRNLAPLAIRALAHVWFRSPEKAVDRALGFNRLSLGSIETKLFDTEPGLQRLQTLQKVLSELFMRHAAPMAPYIAAAMISKTVLERLVHNHGDPDDIQAVLRGLHGNVTTEMDLQVGDLADVARRHPAVADLLSNLPAVEALGKMGDVDGGGEFLQAYQEFLHRYGMRGPSEIDIARVRWQEDPAPLLQVIVGNLSAKGSGAHRRHHADLAALGEAAVEKLAASARHGIMGPLRAAVVRRMGRVARGMFAVREHPKYLIVRAIWFAKQIILQSASQLVQEGRLENEQDVWLLQLHELIDAFKHTERPLGDLIEKRRAEQSHFRGLTPPRLITSDGEIVVAKPSYENLPEGALGGSPVSGGVVEGIARVVLDPSSQVLHPGEILVAPFTDPGWTPLFINAAGLVMEVGGLMTHGSVVAREYGLPAVVGVPEATQLIETGQRIRVDGDQGFVEIVSDGRP
ncbi:MAG: PEP-utilizing enzyme, partial [Anaerolineae bacterium]|nr:PEP-utilizing enzyme [Anaerolineae bacterium]